VPFTQVRSGSVIQASQVVPIPLTTPHIPSSHPPDEEMFPMLLLPYERGEPGCRQKRLSQVVSIRAYRLSSSWYQTGERMFTQVSTDREMNLMLLVGKSGQMREVWGWEIQIDNATSLGLGEVEEKGRTIDLFRDWLIDWRITSFDIGVPAGNRKHIPK